MSSRSAPILGVAEVGLRRRNGNGLRKGNRDKGQRSGQEPSQITHHHYYIANSPGSPTPRGVRLPRLSSGKLLERFSHRAVANPGYPHDTAGTDRTEPCP